MLLFFLSKRLSYVNMEILKYIQPSPSLQTFIKAVNIKKSEYSQKFNINWTELGSVWTFSFIGSSIFKRLPLLNIFCTGSIFLRKFSFLLRKSPSTGTFLFFPESLSKGSFLPRNYPLYELSFSFKNLSVREVSFPGTIP